MPTPAILDEQNFPSFVKAAQELQDSQNVLSNDRSPSPKPSAYATPRDGTSTPPPRRSIHFARSEEFHDASANPISDRIGSESSGQDMSSSSPRHREKLKNRVRSFGLQMKPPAHSRTQSANIAGENLNTASPATDIAYSADTDGEVNDSSVPPSPGPFTFNKKKRRAPQARPDWYTDVAEPDTPMDGKFNGDRGTHSQSPARRPRPAPLRRATMTDVPEGRTEGVSEDEGRARLANTPGWKRRSSAWLQNAQGQSFIRSRRSSRPDDVPESGVLRRLRRSGTNAEETPTRARVNEAREKWKRIAPKVKTAMRMKAKKDKIKAVDYVKSAELMAELLAGSPAAIIFASHFQPDELRKKKTPVLLEQLKISIPTSTKEHTSTDRHVKFQINLEYGAGLTRMEWTISRYLTDFVNLHAKYTGSQLRTGWSRRGVTSGPKKLPRFPKSSFPVLKNMVGASVIPDDEDEDRAGAADESGAEGTLSSPGPTPAIPVTPGPTPAVSHTPVPTPAVSFMPEPTPATAQTMMQSPQTAGLSGRREASQTRRGSSQHLRSYSSNAIRGLGRFPGRTNTSELEQRKEDYSARQRRKLENYLREMIRHFMFRGGSNRLCRFLEISALGVHLAAEGGYHGKEGMLHIKRTGAIRGITHSKWFLVRESYLACVTSPEETVLEDVFLVDPEFKFQSKLPRIRDQKTAKDMAKTAKANSGKVTGHRLKLWNSERTLTLYAKNERQQEQFAESLQKMWLDTAWAKPHRFDSFAPVRQHAHAEWLVEARDYMWKLSRAIDNAENVVYIHDWWLSPELYLRRPPSVCRKWRLDRLLKRKAEQGVKIFVIMYRNINSAIPIDSEYSKLSLLDLHPNIHVQRSPNHVHQTVFFWAHHEKLCVIDNIVAFCGGVDLCFGRYDTPDHCLTDDKATPREGARASEDADDNQTWPGKDYSNPRVQDFYNLFEPYEDMYNRTKTPRMPWHDIGMQLMGQPARDLARHFVQRWNYILRERKSGGARRVRRGLTRPMPTLIPPSDFSPEELEALQLSGTCEVQMLRSCSEWSIGTPNRTERSIQNAYLKLIETSDHFVYIENQFYISSCWVEGVEIKNKIGDALVERIKRAHENDEDWNAVIVIPLMPGFQNMVDEQEGTSVRLIMECQYRSICRGDSSVFGKLRAAGINPTDYIQFYSLRQWGKIGPNKALTTEQLYIHAKCMIVDDRSVIIGSANINERSMLGEHDSEVASVIRDRDFIDSTMAGQPYKVSKFAHSLRMRLMREHLGLDVDGIRTGEVEGWSTSDAVHKLGQTLSQGRHAENLFSAESRSRYLDQPQESNAESFSQSSSGVGTPTSDTRDSSKVRSEGNGSVRGNALGEHGRDSRVLANGREVLLGTGISEGRGTLARPDTSTDSRVEHAQKPLSSQSASSETVTLPPPPAPIRSDTLDLGLPQLSQLPQLPNIDDSDIGGPPVKTFTRISANSLNAFISDLSRPYVEDNCMKDPLSDAFLRETWHKVAENNTKIYRQVFRCMPDNEVQTWTQYKSFNQYSIRFNEAQGISQSRERTAAPNTPNKTGPPGTGTENLVSIKLARLNNNSITSTLTDRRTEKTEQARKDTAASATPPEALRLHTADSVKSQTGSVGTNEPPQEQAGGAGNDSKEDNLNEKIDDQNDDSKKTIAFRNLPSKEDVRHAETPPEEKELNTQSHQNGTGSTRRRRRATTRSSALLRGNDPIMAKEDAEEMMKLVQGHLVVFPYDWLDKENWFFNVDRMAPLEI
ncbi:MAG: hypothetical protein Q9162_004233 [Coniocarpon cinnabarinum]